MTTTDERSDVAMQRPAWVTETELDEGRLSFSRTATAGCEKADDPHVIQNVRLTMSDDMVVCQVDDPWVALGMVEGMSVPDARRFADAILELCDAVEAAQR